MTILGFEVAAPALGLGVLLGMNYALLAVGLVLVYRNSKLVNFAHGDIGVGAAVLLWVAHGSDIPYWICLPLALAAGGLLAATLERSVVERLRRAPRAIAALATLGAGQLILYVAVTLLGATRGEVFPQPPGIPTMKLGTLIIQPAEVLALVLAPITIASLALFLTKSPLGLAMRAAAADLDLARVSGFAGGRLSAATWGMSGVLAAMTAVLLFGVESDSPPPTGLDLLVPTLTAAVLARMSNLVAAGIAGFGLGILQHLLLWNGAGAGLFSVAMFGVVFIAILLSRAGEVDVDKWTRWISLKAGRRISFRNIRVPLVPVATMVTGCLMLVLMRPTDATKLTTVFGFILLALSAAVVTGLSGQLILGQTAYAGLGALASLTITLRTGNFLVAFLAAALVGAASTLISSLPALRRRDLSLPVLSLAFAFACVTWVFPQTWAFGSGTEPGRPIIGSFALTSAKSYALFTLVVLCAGLYLGDLLWRSSLARCLAAQRDNPSAAASFGISAPVARAQGLLISGAIAGVAGALLTHATITVEAGDFSIGEALRALGGAALGGITSVAGSVWGTLFMVGLPSFAGGVLGFISAGWVGWLLIIVTIPGGIVAALPHRAAQGEEIGNGIEREVPSAFSSPAKPQREGNLLAVGDVSVQINELRVLDRVSLAISPGDIVGVVGRNGAGKSTLLDVISGWRFPDGGTVRFEEDEITHLGPERRARIGMARSFEGAILFPTLTVFETTLMALENPAAHTPVPRRDRRREALGVIRWMGLERIASHKVGELSTGLRRMAQLACLTARRPRLLLLDEPASGIAQAELDGLIRLLDVINKELGTAILIVEHDLRVVHKLAAHVMVLDGGRVVASGAPDEVLGRPTGQG